MTVRVFHHYFSGRKAVFFFAESAAIGGSCFLGEAMMAAAFAPKGASPATSVLPALGVLALGLVGLFQFVLYLLDLYDLKVAGEDRERGMRAVRASGVAIAVLAPLALVASRFVPPGALLGGALGAVAGSLLVRAAMEVVVGRPQRVLIVGAGEPALAVARAVEAEGEGAFQICATVDPAPARAEAGDPGVQPIDGLAASLGADYVVAADEVRDPGSAAALLECRLAGRRVYDAAGFFERVLRRIPVSHLRATDLAFSDELRVGRGRRMMKRLVDVAVASLLALAAAPLMVLVAALIKIDSPGPIFYRQERVGLHGRKYRLWKFRSMRTDAEKNGAVWAKQNDDRVTRVGRVIRKMRIDEIPQVFNVLVGDMSFVGPRPERPVFVEQLKAQIPFYGLREVVKPGITGWAQIRYPYGASVEDARNKLEFDLYYVKNGSLMLDLAIIFHTVRHVLLGRGAR